MSQENSNNLNHIDYDDPITNYLVTGRGDPVELAKIDPKQKDETVQSTDHGYSLEAHRAEPSSDPAKDKVLDDIFDLSHEIDPVEAVGRLDGVGDVAVKADTESRDKPESSSETIGRDYNLKVHQAKPLDPDTDRILDEIFDLEREVDPAQAVQSLDHPDNERPFLGEKKQPEIKTSERKVEDGEDTILLNVQILKARLGESFYETQKIDSFFEKADAIELDETGRDILETLKANREKYETLVTLEKSYRKTRELLTELSEKALEELPAALKEIDPSDLDKNLPDQLFEIMAQIEMIREIEENSPDKVLLERFIERESGSPDVKSEQVKVETLESAEETLNDMEREQLEAKIKSSLLKRLESVQGTLDKGVFLDQSSQLKEILDVVVREAELKKRIEKKVLGHQIDEELRDMVEDMILLDLTKNAPLTGKRINGEFVEDEKVLEYEYLLAESNLAIKKLAEQEGLHEESIRAIIGLPQVDDLEATYTDVFHEKTKLQRPLDSWSIEKYWQSIISEDEALHQVRKKKSKFKRFMGYVFGR